MKLVEGQPEAGIRVATFSDDRAKAALEGKNLACWCAVDQTCHADVLLEIANEAGG